MSRRLHLPAPAWIFSAFALIAVAVPTVVKIGVDHASPASQTEAGLGDDTALGSATTDASNLVAGIGTPPPTLSDGAVVAGGASAVSALAAPEETTTTAPLPWILGQRPFAARSSWNTPIPSGARYVNIGMPPVEINNYWVDWDFYAPAVWFSHPSDPLVKVTHPSGWGYPAGTLEIHLPDGITGAKGGDHSILVVDGTKVYNMWQFNRTSATTATAKAFAQADVLSGTGWGAYRSDGQPLGAGITAAGHSMLAGLLIQSETDGGEIRHALQLSVDGRLNRLRGRGHPQRRRRQRRDHAAGPAPGHPPGRAHAGRLVAARPEGVPGAADLRRLRHRHLGRIHRAAGPEQRLRLEDDRQAPQRFQEDGSSAPRGELVAAGPLRAIQSGVAHRRPRTAPRRTPRSIIRAAMSTPTRSTTSSAVRV